MAASSKAFLAPTRVRAEASCVLTVFSLRAGPRPDHPALPVPRAHLRGRRQSGAASRRSRSAPGRDHQARRRRFRHPGQELGHRQKRLRHSNPRPISPALKRRPRLKPATSGGCRKGLSHVRRLQCHQSSNLPTTRACATPTRPASSSWSRWGAARTRASRTGRRHRTMRRVRTATPDKRRRARRRRPIQACATRPRRVCFQANAVLGSGRIRRAPGIVHRQAQRCRSREQFHERQHDRRERLRCVAEAPRREPGAGGAIPPGRAIAGAPGEACVAALGHAGRSRDSDRPAACRELPGVPDGLLAEGNPHGELAQTPNERAEIGQRRVVDAWIFG
jgi:hypothetical protein